MPAISYPTDPGSVSPVATTTVDIGSIGSVNFDVIAMAQVLVAAYLRFSSPGRRHQGAGPLTQTCSIGTASYSIQWTPFAPIAYTGYNGGALTESGKLTIHRTSGGSSSQIAAYMVPYAEIANPSNWSSMVTATITA